jgi:hypothetical protein
MKVGAPTVDPFYLCDDRLFDLSVAMVNRHARSELDLVCAVYADPGWLGPFATGLGVHAGHFNQDDLQILFKVAVAAGGSRKSEVLGRARVELRASGFWDPTQISGNFGLSSLWCDKLLVRLSAEWFPSEPIVAMYARRLLLTDARQRDAVLAYERCVDLLEDRIAPATGIATLPELEQKKRGAA